MYQYTYRLRALELWQLSMYYVYGSMIGVCNIVFTVAVFALTIAKWADVGPLLRLLMILGCLLFTVIQPVLTYRRAKKQAVGIREDTRVTFDELGMLVKVGEAGERIQWERIKRVSRKPTMLIVFCDTTHGYVLSDRVTGAQKEALYEYILARMGKAGTSKRRQ